MKKKPVRRLSDPSALSSRAALERAKRIQQAMIPLVNDPRFKDFMAEVEQQQKSAVIDVCSERVIANERICMATLGEIRTYDGLISFYQAQLDLAEQNQLPLEQE